MKHVKIIAFSLLVLFFAAGGLRAQDDEQSGMIKTAGGILIVWNEPNNNYTLEVKGSEVRPLEGERIMFSADGKLLQVVTVAKKDFLKAGQEKADEKTVLHAHRDWESNYLEGVLKEKLVVNSAWQKLPNGRDALSWDFEMPAKTGGDVKKQVFLIVSKGDYVLVLNSLVTGQVDEKTARQFLIDTMTTLKINEKPLSLAKAREQILKEN